VIGERVIRLLLMLPLAASQGCAWMYRYPEHPNAAPASVINEPAEPIDLSVEVEEPSSV